MSAQPLNDVQAWVNPFEFAQHSVRTAIGPDGQIWFCARDVYAALGLVWKGGQGSLKNTPADWQGVCYLQTPGGFQRTILLNEAAVYQTAFRSSRPEALAFTRWVCAEVLPALRKQGHYGRLPTRERLALSKQLVSTTQALTNSRDALARALLLDELRELCSLLGRTLPDIGLLGQDWRQAALPLGGGVA
ncbi:MAG: BRO family protein [Pseudomonadota bacterium]|nr:BRO family protein [Pseudomonadota bacterium]